MKNQFALNAGVLAMAAFLGACTTVLLPPNIAPVVAPSRSAEEAASRLEAVKTARLRIEAEYAASEQLCYAKFFVNNCLDAAKEKRRSGLAQQNAVEVEAEYFQRKAKVDQRDRDVAQAVREFEASEAVRAALPPPKPQAEPKPPAKAPKPSLAARQASQEARVAQKAADDQAEAPRRAVRAKESEERKKESEERQREVEQRKAGKEGK